MATEISTTRGLFQVMTHLLICSDLGDEPQIVSERRLRESTRMTASGMPDPERRPQIGQTPLAHCMCAQSTASRTAPSSIPSTMAAKRPAETSSSGRYS